MMKKNAIIPRHELPKLHENATTISFENCYKLGKIYKEIVGENGIHHLSINVVDESGKMTILSYRPEIAYNIFKDGSYRYNGSISRTYYSQKKIYTWDETYDPHYYNTLKNKMERRNGIEKGIVFVRNQLGMTILYSFATKSDGQEFVLKAHEQQELFYAMGDHCFEQIKSIIQASVIEYNLNQTQASDTNIIRFPIRARL